MRRSLLVLKPVLFFLVAALGMAAQAADSTVFHYQVLPGHSPQSCGNVAGRSVTGRAAAGTATLSDSSKDSLVSTGSGADKFTDVFTSTSAAINAKVPLGADFDFSTVDASTSISASVGNYSFDGTLGDAEKLNLNAGTAVFLQTAEVTNAAGNTKVVKIGTVTLKWNRRTAILTVKATQKVAAKLVAQGADQGATIISYPVDSDGPFTQDVDLFVSFGDASVDLVGSMSGTQKTKDKSNAQGDFTLVTAHAKGKATAQ